jgi:lipid-binding SYLF domain-containing protein
MMSKISSFGAAFAFAALLFTNSGTAVASEQTELLDRAARTVEHMKVAPEFERARSMMKDAKAILVVPSLVRGGFIFGAEGGNGVLMRNNGGTWSEPAFYTMGSASFGLQAGLERTEVVMLIMSDRALDALMQAEFKFGAGASLTLVDLSAGASANTAPNLSGDIIIWTSGMGLYGGLTLNGSIVKARDEWNTAFYGMPVQVSEILANRVRSPAANPIRQQLASLN